MTVKSTLSDVPVIGGILGGLWGGPTDSEQNYQDAMAKMLADYEAYRNQYQGASEQSLKNQMGAMSGWEKLISDIYGGQYLPKVETKSPFNTGDM